MQENYEYVQRGFRKLVFSMSGFIGQEMNKVYKDNWWDVILDVLSDQRDLPWGGTYGELVDSLDIANCIRILDRQWNDVFRYILPADCRTWAKELMGVRNIVSHLGQQDMEQPMAERALDTMSLLCQELDPEGAEELRDIYRQVRARANDSVPHSAAVVYSGVAQPETDSKRGTLTEGSLLQMVGTDVVQKTAQTRKVTYGGKTVLYPVYKVRLDVLYYNDQNDRIATWITRYESENGKNSLEGLNMDIYNRIIENFISDSNPEALSRTQKNIALIGQKEPGVTLADGRIVDGNRRFTCLRRLQREKTEPLYFETVIMDMDIQEDRKQIKLLELSIQHGEEKKVDYDYIDYAIGTYRDVVQTHLLTVEEYAASTNETISDVKKRIEIAGIISEFLDYIKLPEKYHVARDYQLYSLFQEMLAPLKKLDEGEKKQLKEIAFNNVIMEALTDQRKFIRDIKSLVNNGMHKPFFEEQSKIGEQLREKYQHAEIRSRADVQKFAAENTGVKEELQYSMERALHRYRAATLKSKPWENVEKSISLMTAVDSRLFSRLDEEEKEKLNCGLSELAMIVKRFQELLSNQ